MISDWFGQRATDSLPVCERISLPSNDDQDRSVSSAHMRGGGPAATA